MSTNYQSYHQVNVFDSWKEEEASLLQTVQTGCWVLPASYSVGTGGSFFRDKGASAWRRPFIIYEVPRLRMHWTIHLLPHMPLWCVLNKHRDMFTFCQHVSADFSHCLSFASTYMCILVKGLILQLYPAPKTVSAHLIYEVFYSSEGSYFGLLGYDTNIWEEQAAFQNAAPNMKAVFLL